MSLQKWLLFGLVCFAILRLNAQTDIIRVWPDGAPGAIFNKEYKEGIQYDSNNSIRGYSKVWNPTLTVFRASKKLTNGTSVVVCPGGGYSHLAIEKEGYKVAKWLNSMGITAFVLKYRMPSDETMQNKVIGPLQDAQEAIRIIRRNASQWDLNPNKIGILGFSAGGHLAATLSTQYDKPVYKVSNPISARPDFSILVYPVVTMKGNYTHKGSRENLIGKQPDNEMVKEFSNEEQVDGNTPPTFLVHATDDGAVPVENSIQYYSALKKNKVKTELHIYEDGGHGFGLGRSGTHTAWPKACKDWLKANDFLAEKEVFLFSYFKGNGEDGLHLAYSDNGFDWKVLNDDKPFLKPVVGKDSLMRDPCIIKGPKGIFHMVWTVSWTDKGIGYANSKDLVHWSEQQFIPVMEKYEGARNTWAPEITFDETSGQYMIYWASTVKGEFPETQSKLENAYNHRMYYTLTKDFKSFDETKLLYEPGFNVIDATIHRAGDKYVMFLKDETREPAQKNLKVSYSTKITGPYSKAGTPITGDYWAEGPAAIKMKEKWIVYFDKYVDHEYGAVQSNDLKVWEDISDKINFPKGARHGSIFKVPEELFKQMVKSD